MLLFVWIVTRLLSSINKLIISSFWNDCLFLLDLLAKQRCLENLDIVLDLFRVLLRLLLSEINVSKLVWTIKC